MRRSCLARSIVDVLSHTCGFSSTEVSAYSAVAVLGFALHIGCYITITHTTRRPTNATHARYEIFSLRFFMCDTISCMGKFSSPVYHYCFWLRSRRA